MHEEPKPTILQELYVRVQQKLSPVAWLLNGEYPEPSEEMKPFVFALMDRAIDGDEDAVAALQKLFPPRCSG